MRSGRSLAAASAGSVCPADVVKRQRYKKVKPKDVLEKTERKQALLAKFKLLRTRKPLDVPAKGRVGLKQFCRVV